MHVCVCLKLKNKAHGFIIEKIIPSVFTMYYLCIEAYTLALRAFYHEHLHCGGFYVWFLWGGGFPSQLINHHIHHLCQLKSFDEVNNYQIVALTTLWSFLAHEVAQNFILKDLNVGGEQRLHRAKKHSQSNQAAVFVTVIDLATSQFSSHSEVKNV